MIPTARSILVVKSALHPIVQDYATRVAANSGTISSGDLTALSNFVASEQTRGLIEAGLTTGQTSSSSVLRQITPFAGNDLNAALVKLLYPSGSSGLVTNQTACTYSRTAGITSPATSSHYLDLNYIPSSYHSGTATGNHTILIHTTPTNSLFRVAGSYNGLQQQIRFFIDANRLRSTMYTDNTGADYVQHNTNSVYTGLWITTKNSGVLSLHRDGSQVDSKTPGLAGTIPTNSYQIFSQPTLTGTANYTCRYHAIGGSGISTASVPGYSTAIATLQTAIRS